MAAFRIHRSPLDTRLNHRDLPVKAPSGKEGTLAGYFLPCADYSVMNRFDSGLGLVVCFNITNNMAFILDIFQYLNELSIHFESDQTVIC